MKHTTHYRVKQLTTLINYHTDKPLSSAPFFEAPREYCEREDPKTHALIHYSKCREEIL